MYAEIQTTFSGFLSLFIEVTDENYLFEPYLSEPASFIEYFDWSYDWIFIYVCKSASIRNFSSILMSLYLCPTVYVFNLTRQRCFVFYLPLRNGTCSKYLKAHKTGNNCKLILNKTENGMMRRTNIIVPCVILLIYLIGFAGRQICLKKNRDLIWVPMFC